MSDVDSEEPTGEIGREMVDQDVGLGSVMAHLYRGEMAREISWRERLDSTTNWAVTVISGILAYAFSSDEIAHSIILAGMAIGIMFLIIEARRFQRYDVWRSRVRSLQENLFANALDPSGGIEQEDWRQQLSEDYRHPEVRISLQTALAHRLRRVYLPLLIGLLLVWLFRLNGSDEPLVQAAALSSTPGTVVVGVVAVAYASLLALAFWPGLESVSEVDENTDRGDLRKNG